jgi:lysozyme family protein
MSKIKIALNNFLNFIFKVFQAIIKELEKYNGKKVIMADYRDAINKVLIHEGGFVNHPNDRGGPTNWGVTKKTYDEYMTQVTGKPYISTVDEIKKMPKGNAVTIYKTLYWDKMQGDKIIKYAIALVIFDQAINRGVTSAVKQAQRVLKTQFGYPSITEDGNVGKYTLDAINAVGNNIENEKKFITSYIKESQIFYDNIIKRDPTQAVFGKGWTARLTSLLSEGVSKIGITNATAIKAGSSVAILILGIGIYFLIKKYGGTPMPVMVGA